MNTYATIKIVHVTCHCGVHFGLDESTYERALQTGETFYCPRGHQCSYHKNENQRLKDELTRAKQRAEQLEATVREEKRRTLSASQSAEYFRKSRDGMKGALVKAKKRAVAGVCPCCTRTFQNVARHMATKHPEMVVAPPSGEKEGE